MASAQDVQHIAILYVAVLFIIIGFATNSWKSTYDDVVEVYAGLFEYCTKTEVKILGSHGESKGCNEYNEEPEVRIMVILGMIVAVLCAIAMTVHHAMKSKSDETIKKLPKIVLGAAIVGAVIIIVACIMYAYNRFGETRIGPLTLQKMYPGYSFFLTLIGAFLLIGGGVAGHKK